MTKMFDKVSQDFLDAIKGVMEAKKVNKHGHDLPGEEDDDIDNDGDSDKSDKYLHNRRKAISKAMKEDDDVPFAAPYRKKSDRKDEYGNRVKNVAKHLARKAMKANEEVELDEMSSKMKMKLGLYGKKKKMKEEAEGLEESFLTPNAHAEFKNMPKDAVKRHHDVYVSTAATFKKNGSHALSAAAMGAANEIKRKYLGEEAEELDELSNDTMLNYMDKASDAKGHRKLSTKKVDNRYAGVKKASDKLTKEEAEQIDEISTKTVDSYREKAFMQQPAGDDGSQLYKKRKAGRDMAFKKVTHGAKVMAKEEVADLDEVSKKTLGSYTYKAASDLGSRGITTGLKIAADEPTEKNFKKMGNRQRGIARAAMKLSKEEIEMIEAKMAGVADGALPGKEHMCATKVFHKEWNEGTPVKTMHAEPDADGLIEWYDVMFEHGIERVMTEEMEVLQAESHMHSKKMKEEIDAVDEAAGEAPKGYGGRPVTGSRAAYWKYMRSLEKHYGDKTPVKKKMKEGYVPTSDEPTTADKKTADKVRAMMAKEKVKKETEELDEMSSKMKMKLGLYGKKKKMKEEAEDLDEARGRPKKAAAKDFTVHPVTKEKLMHNNPQHMARIEKLQKTGAIEKPKTEAAQNIISQLRKAAVSMQGGSTVHFTHGESKEVSATNARKAIEKHAGMRPSEKEDFQKKISHSHDQLMKHI